MKTKTIHCIFCRPGSDSIKKQLPPAKSTLCVASVTGRCCAYCKSFKDCLSRVTNSPGMHTSLMGFVVPATPIGDFECGSFGQGVPANPPSVRSLPGDFNQNRTVSFTVRVSGAQDRRTRSGSLNENQADHLSCCVQMEQRGI